MTTNGEPSNGQVWGTVILLVLLSLLFVYYEAWTLIAILIAGPSFILVVFGLIRYMIDQKTNVGDNLQ